MHALVLLLYIILLFVVVLLHVVYATYFERKIIGHMQQIANTTIISISFLRMQAIPVLNTH